MESINQITFSATYYSDGRTTKNYYYDIFGNLTNDGEYSYTYDAYYNRLATSKNLATNQVTIYDYYVDGLRKSKGSTYYIWLDGNMVYEFSGSDSSTYTYGHRLLYSDDVKYVLNAHGDVVALLNNSGVVTKRYDYDAFGNELGIDNTDTNTFRYCGEYFDVETGQIYLRNRYYQPVTGRFTQLDPIKDGLNWYAYCYNNPVVFTDASGLDAIILTNEDSAGGFGHTSLLVQDSDGNWYYTYWGKQAAAVIQLPDDIVRYTLNGEIVESTMSSMENFNSALNDSLSFYGLNNITKDYTAATYVTGDFTKSLEQAYQNVNDASNHRGSDGTVLTFDDKKL